MPPGRWHPNNAGVSGWLRGGILPAVTASAPAPVPARVLHVANHVRPHMGGIETVVAAETQGLLERGWQVSVLTSSWTVGAGERTEDGVRTVRVSAWNGIERASGVPFAVLSPRVVPVMLREVRRADVVHVHDVLYLSSWVAAVCCMLLRTPYVVHRHVGFVHHTSLLVRVAQAVVLRTVGVLVLARAAAVLPIDEQVAAELRRTVRRPERVEVLGNGVDTSLFRPMSTVERRRARAALGLPADECLALFVGRFVPKKGFATVAAAASDECRIVFAGGDRPTGLDDPRLHFLGELAPAEMPAVYGCVDVMVIASVGECPLTVLEAMSSGLPVLANDDPALHSPWTAGPGVRFVDMAAGDLPEALRKLVADPEAMGELGAEGHDHVQAAFSWTAHLDTLESVYQRVLV